jgi:hypothetical protein
MTEGTETPVLPEVVEENTITMIDGVPFYVTKDRYGEPAITHNIEITRINPMLLRMAMQAVHLPKRPNYETRLPSGRTETHPLDEVSAAENPRDQARWEAYSEEKEEAQGERTNVSMRATFYYGTKFSPPDNGWDDEQRMLGIDVPTQKELRKAHYLMSILTVGDMNGLMRAITRNMTASEEAVQAAEDSF